MLYGPQGVKLYHTNRGSGAGHDFAQAWGKWKEAAVFAAGFSEPLLS